MADIYQLEMIRRDIARLYKTHPQVHVNVKTTSPRIQLENAPAVIRGVYRNLFTISETAAGQEKTHTLSYTDILTGEVEILELTRK